jgi:hypothetical protein
LLRYEHDAEKRVYDQFFFISKALRRFRDGVTMLYL